MKSRISIVLATVVAFMIGASVALHAQTQINTLFKVEIPFNFMVGSAHLSAGHYTVFHVGSKWVLFQRSDGKATALLPVVVSSTPEGQSSSKLVFKTYENRYFLSQVWTEEDNQLHECYKCSAEETLLASRQQSGTVTVAAER